MRLSRQSTLLNFVISLSYGGLYGGLMIDHYIMQYCLLKYDSQRLVDQTSRLVVMFVMLCQPMLCYVMFIILYYIIIIIIIITSNCSRCGSLVLQHNAQRTVMRQMHAMVCYVLVYRARRAEARIQQMLWKVNYSDIVFINTVCVTLLLALVRRSQVVQKEVTVNDTGLDIVMEITGVGLGQPILLLYSLTIVSAVLPLNRQLTSVTILYIVQPGPCKPSAQEILICTHRNRELFQQTSLLQVAQLETHTNQNDD